MEFDTQVIHEISGQDKATGATIPAIYQVSAFAQDSAEQLEKVFNNRAPGFAYTRIGNPTVDVFEKKIAALEHGVGAIACSSGMAAVTMALLNIVEAGDEIIASAGLFGGTIDLFRDLQPFGITVKYVSEVTKEEIEPLITEQTKAVFTELIGNPRLDVVDIKSVSDFLHDREIPFFVDSTTATPYLIRPIDLGADVVIHSSSKYINGGGNSISGVIIDSGKFKWNPGRYKGFKEYKMYGKFAFIAKLRNGLWRNVGGCLAPQNAFYNLIGIETLGLRMQRICENAQALAEFFEANGIEVNYPGLKSSPYYELVQSQFRGLGGGIITIRSGSKERAYKLVNNLKYATIATNIGDTRTLVIHAASTIYIHSSEEQKKNAGVFDDTIRISVGIENTNDLIEDFKQAIESIK